MSLVGPETSNKRDLKNVLVAMILALAVFGCASPPTAEKEAAGRALEDAKASGAEGYTISELATALDAFKAGESLSAAKDYKEAKRFYLKAKDFAERAATKARSAAQLEKQFPEIEQRWQNLQGQMRVFAYRLGLGQMGFWQADVDKLVMGLQSAKTMTRRDPMKANEELKTATAIIEKWEGMIKASVSQEVRGLMGDLESADGDRIRRAAVALAAMGPAAAEAVPALIDVLERNVPGDQPLYVKHPAAVALGRIGRAANSAIRPLCKYVRTRHHEVEDINDGRRAEGVNALMQIAPESSEVMSCLIAAVSDSDNVLAVMRAADALASMGKKAEPAIPALRQCKITPPYVWAVQTCDRALKAIRGY